MHFMVPKTAADLMFPSPLGDCLIKRVDYRKENNMQNLAVFPSPSGDYLI